MILFRHNKFCSHNLFMVGSHCAPWYGYNGPCDFVTWSINPIETFTSVYNLFSLINVCMGTIASLEYMYIHCMQKLATCTKYIFDTSYKLRLAKLIFYLCTFVKIFDAVWPEIHVHVFAKKIKLLKQLNFCKPIMWFY